MFLLPGIVAATPSSVTVGNLRIQAISPNLVRIEERGPKGFEDRATFHVVRRDFSNVAVRTTTKGDTVEIQGGNWKVRVKNSSSNTLSDAVLLDRKGNVLYQPSPIPVASQFLPAPGKMPKVWAMSDYPRLVPPAWGATPAPANVPDQGWDRGNNATDLYLFVPDTYETLRRDFLRLTGPTEKPPLYAFGFIDSRFHPYTEEEALGVIDTYRRKRIPLDMFVVDTDWRKGGSDGYDTETKYFPDMARFLKEAHDRKVRIMFNDHPNPTTKDPLAPSELKVRYDGLTGLMGQGVDVWWYDRNWHTSLGEPLPGLRKEVWGQRLYHDITQRFRPDQRPLIMTNFQGIDNGARHYAPQPASHRYSIWWTGDTGSTFGDLRRGVENGVDMGVLALAPYVGEDLGGHTGQPSDELYVRFLQYGCLSPTTRIHCTRGRIRYPWAFSPEAEKIVTDYIRLRYRLLPTLYTAAQHAYEDGTPLLRRPDLEWPAYPEASRNDEYLLGDDLLVAPIVSSEAEDAQPIPSDGLKAEYFANRNLTGNPTLTRTDKQIQFDWGDGAPASGLPSDDFSARWTGEIGPVPKSGDYTFVMQSDDGVRVWLDDKPLLNFWRPQNEETHTVRVRLEAGSRHRLRVEYYEATGGAMIHFGWIPPSERSSLSERDVWIPPGEWRSLHSGQVVRGPQKIRASAPLAQCPMWARVGGLVTLAPEMQYTGERPWDELTLEGFVPSRDGSTRREIVEDDGITNAYQKGQVARTNLEFSRSGNEVNVRIAPGKGSYPGEVKARSWRLRLNMPVGTRIDSVSVNGAPVRNYQVIDPVRSPWRGVPLPGGLASVPGTRVLVIDLPKQDRSHESKVQVRLN